MGFYFRKSCSKRDENLGLTLKSTVRFITAKVGNILLRKDNTTKDPQFYQSILDGYTNREDNCLVNTNFFREDSVEVVERSGDKDLANRHMSYSGVILRFYIIYIVQMFLQHFLN